MPLGTLDRTPPPFFRQGPSAFTRLVFFSAFAIFLMVADRRFNVVEPVRATLATALLPVQRALAWPGWAWDEALQYLKGLEDAREAERRAREQLSGQAVQAALVHTLEAENQRLRELVGLAPSLKVRSQAAEFMYEAADPYSRKFYINRGSTHGVQAGSPVINEAGVIGQVTRVYPLSSEVTQLSDKDAAIPVLNPRTQQRASAYGGASGGAMELRFTSANADVQAGDLLVTGGVDGVYPPGLAVARVSSVERRAESGFARILLELAAPADGVRHVLVLEPLMRQWPPPPAPAAAASAPPAREGTPRRRAPAGPGR